MPIELLKCKELAAAMGRDKWGGRSRTYRVYVEQVNQTYVEVKARSREEARELGYAKWRRDNAHSQVTWVEEA